MSFTFPASAWHFALSSTCQMQDRSNIFRRNLSSVSFFYWEVYICKLWSAVLTCCLLPPVCAECDECDHLSIWGSTHHNTGLNATHILTVHLPPRQVEVALYGCKRQRVQFPGWQHAASVCDLAACVHILAIRSSYCLGCCRQAARG